MLRALALVLGSTFLLTACGSGGTGTTGTGGASSTTTGAGGNTTSAGGASSTSSATATGAGGGATTSTGSGTSTGSSTGSAGGGPPAAPTPADILNALGMCNVVSMGNYQTDADPGTPANIPICGLAKAVYWKADMDVDCDGKVTAQCNLQADPAFQSQTSATDSNGDPLDAAALPYVVVPLPSSRFNYNTAGLALGSVIAVIYNNKIEYGVFGDEGPKAIIGEASYAMAQSLGIDPDPSTGGVDSGVTYIAFTGPGAVVKKIEDHAEAVALGKQLVAALVSGP